MTMKKTPTLEQFSAFQAAYDYFNRTLFQGKLKPCLLNFRGKHKRNMGLFWPKKWVRADGGVTHEIALNPEVLLRPLMETFATLVHEMVHQWQQDFGTPSRSGYHDRQWGQQMEVVGLIPSNTGEPGGKKTGQQMTHYVAKDGPFEAAFVKMPKAVSLPWLTGSLPDNLKSPSKNKNKVKYVCECGTIVWGKADLFILCGECEEQFSQQE